MSVILKHGWQDSVDADNENSIGMSGASCSWGIRYLETVWMYGESLYERLDDSMMKAAN